MEIIFVTGNEYKFQVAQKALENSDLILIQKKIETPEIQSTDVEEIASYSAKFASRELHMPVALTDAGYYIEALNGFPGPFIKYINKWLTANDLLQIMEGKENRSVTVKACLAYCEPNQEPITFVTEVHGKLALKAVKGEKEGSTSINEIFIPEGYDKVETEISKEEMVKFWSQVENYWGKLAEHLKKT